MTSWKPIFLTYLVPAVIGLPLILLWDSLSCRRKLAPCHAMSLSPMLPSQSLRRANSNRRMRRMCPNIVNGGQP
jgi:hypothetical protein